MLRAILSVVVCVYLSSALESASAQAPDEYRELIREGLAEYDAGNWPEAKYFFTKAHEAYPNARTLRGLGMVEFALRDYVEAAGHLDRALQDPINPLTAEMRERVSQLLEQSRGFIAEVQLDVVPATAEVRIDGHPHTLAADGKIRLNPGSHEFSVGLSGYETVVRRLELDVGARVPLRVELPEQRPDPGPTAIVPVAATVQPSPAPVPSGKPAPPAESDFDRIAPWVVVGVGGALVVGGGILVGLAVADVNSVEEADNPTEWSSVSDAYDRSTGRSATGIVLISLGALGIAGGLAWKFWPGTEDDSVAVQLTPGGVQIRGRL
jgi:hypothetical protein